MERLEKILQLGGTKRDIAFLIISGLALIIGLFDPSWMPFDASWIAVILCGVPIVLGAFIGLVTRFDIRAGVLVSLALIASIIIDEIFAAGEIAFIMQLGEQLENMTVSKARAGIEKLVNLTPRTARILKDGKTSVIPAEDVKVGDILRVLPGETIPVDGIICLGSTSVNQAVMTGESLPVDKGVGDEVSSGTVNQFGSFDMRATKVGEDSSICRMIRLVQSADAGKAKIVRIADRWATWIVVMALTAAALTWTISGEVIRAVTILVVFCPCALVLATPTAIMAAIGNVTKHGFLVREGDALERLAKVAKITFDKTGTLTYGKPRVIGVESFSADYSADQIFIYAATVENRSEHPLGKAVVVDFSKNHSQGMLSIKEFKMLPGKGVKGIINNDDVMVGSESLLQDANLSLNDKHLQQVERYLNQGCTVIYVVINGVVSGFLALSDTLRDDAPAMIQKIKATGVTPVMLTGDHEMAAKNIAAKLQIDEVCANCLPEDKLQLIDSYQRNNEFVCMIGDGINDAPALKKSYVGIAMGGIGSDIAVDAADIVLVDDEIKELPHLIYLSRRMMTTIKCNLVFSMLLNFIAVVLAIMGILNPVVGALVHNAGSVLVIINSAFLLNWKVKNDC
jgi:heavy metal translocating P-type ATPase